MNDEKIGLAVVLALTSFGVHASGYGHVHLVSSVPARGIERPVASVIRSWEWENVSGAANQAEEKLIRLDFCMGGGSQAEVEQLCVAQSQYACSA